jgi:hypothetical protein
MFHLQLLQLHRVEAALITSAECLLALPALMASYPELIQGPIFATVAAVDLAFHYLAELTNSPAGSGPGQCCSDQGDMSDSSTGTGVLEELLLSQLAGGGSASGQDVQAGNLKQHVLRHCWLPVPAYEQAQALLSRVKVSSRDASRGFSEHWATPATQH